MRDEMRASHRLLLAGLATFGLMGFGQSLFGPTLPEVTRLFLLRPGQAALLISAQWVGSAIGVGLMFALSSRVVPRHTLALLVLGAVGLALQPGWGAMLAASVLFGVGYGMAAATFNPRVLRAFGDRGASMLSLLNAAYAGGAILAPLLFVALGSASAPVFAMTAAGCLMVWLMAGEPAPEGGVRPPPPAPPGFRLHWPILIFGALGVASEACLIGLGPTALIAAGETEERAAQLLSAFFVVFLMARIVLGVMAHRVPPFGIFLAAIGWTAAMATLALTLSPGLAFVALGLSAGMFFPGFFVTASRKMGEDPRVAPVILSAGLVGGVGAPFLVARLMGTLGDLGFFWLLAGVALPATVAGLLAFRAMNRP